MTDVGKYLAQNFSRPLRQARPQLPSKVDPPCLGATPPLRNRTTSEEGPAAGAFGPGPQDAHVYHALDPTLLRRCRWPSDPTRPWCGTAVHGHAPTSTEQCSRDSCALWEAPSERRTSRSRSASGDAAPNPGKSPSTQDRHPVRCPRRPRGLQVSVPSLGWAPRGCPPSAWRHPLARTGLEAGAGGRLPSLPRSRQAHAPEC